MDLAVDQAGAGDRWSLTAGVAGWGLQPVTHIARQAPLLAARRAGRIVTHAGRLVAVYGRWWPHAGNLLQVHWDQYWRSLPSDFCELYYHAPWSVPNYLTVDYVRSGRGTSLSSLYAATLALDAIAQVRQSAAIVCHLSNSRLSDRLLRRWGWQPHCEHWHGRHFIKRFYGQYPEIPAAWRQRLTVDGIISRSALAPGFRRNQMPTHSQ